MRRIMLELKRRKVFRSAAIYIVGAWVAIQVVDQALPALNTPDEAIRFAWIAAIVGFPIAMLFSWRYDFADGGLTRTPPALAKGDIDLSLRIIDFIILLALLSLSGVAVWQAARGIGDAQHPMANYAIELEAPANSIVVLPLRALGQWADSDYFSDGLTEELSYTLNRLPQLRVTASRSAYTVARLGLDVREIGRRLGVRYILDGSVRRAKERLRVNIELLEADTGLRVWQADFDEESKDLLALQERIADSVMTALKSPLSVVDTLTVARDTTESPIAQDLYWMGMDEVRQMNSKWNYGDWVNRAIDYFEQAIEADPDFAEAHARLARTHLYFLWSIRGNLFESSTRTAENHIARALALNPNSITALLASSRILYSRYDVDGYTAVLQHILTIEPSNYAALTALGTQYWQSGKFDQATELFDTAYLRNPLSPDAIKLKARINSNLGDYDGARKLLIELMGEDPHAAAESLIAVELRRGRLDDVARWASLLQRQEGGALASAFMAKSAISLEEYDIAEQWVREIDTSARSLTIFTELIFLLAAGRAQEAIATADQVVREFIPETAGKLNPQQGQLLSRLAFIFAVGNENERAMSEWGRVAPGMKNNYAIHEQLNFLSAMSVAAQATGDTEEARDLADNLDRILSAREASRNTPGYQFVRSRGEWHAARGDHDAAIEHLSLAYDLGFRDAARIRVLPVWSELRDNPALIRIIERMESDITSMRRRALEEGWLRAPD